jgi:large subunit ribosomal protein L4
MEAPILSAANKKVGTAELNEAIFADVNEALIWEMVRLQTAKRRSGTHCVKNRSAVAGGGAKPYRQKGTGRARMGTRSSPILRGGGVVFGPTPRSYAYSMPKKKRKAAVFAALSSKYRDEELILLDSLGIDEIKTKKMASVLEALGVTNALIIISEANEFIEKSARNLPNIKVLRSEGLNVYDMLRFDKLIVVGDALDKIQGGQ